MNIQNVIGLGQAPQSDLRAGEVTPKGEVAPRVVTQAPVQQQQKPEPTPQQLQQAVQAINRKLSDSTSLEFSVDQNSHTTIVKVMDKDSGELIRQIPSEAALAIAESIGEFQKGMLLKQKA